MVKKIFYKVRGFTPLELLIVVSISAVVAGLFIFTANAPQPMASVPPISVNVEQLQVTVSQQDVNINVEQPQVFALGAATARRGNIAHAHPSPHSDHVVDLGGDACEVIPTGDYSQDAYHVQYAVDNCSDVTLKAGIFNFGGYQNLTEPRSKIIIRKDIVIHGAGFHPNGDPKTKIVGGIDTFTSGVDHTGGSTLVDANGNPVPAFETYGAASITIKNLWFDGAKGAAIALAAAKGTTNIHNNKITNVHNIPNPLPPPYYPPLGVVNEILFYPGGPGLPPLAIYEWGRAYGIFVGRNASMYVYSLMYGYPIPAIEGTVKISGNYIDLNVNHTLDTEHKSTETNPGAVGIGIGTMLCNTEKMTIKNNTVKNCSSNGIVGFDNTGIQEIKNNDIDIGTITGLLEVMPYVAAIGVGPVNTIMFGADRVEEKVIVRNNNIKCSGIHEDTPLFLDTDFEIERFGIIVGTANEGTVIYKNHITLDNGPEYRENISAIGFTSTELAKEYIASNMVYSNNTFSGTAKHIFAATVDYTGSPVQAGDDPQPFLFENNTITISDNDLIGWSTITPCDILLSDRANYNEVILDDDTQLTVCDDGKGNEW